MAIASPPDLLASYRPVPGAYDEMVAADGRVRDHWAHAGQVLANLGLDELLYRRSEARRLLDDDGVTYNVYGPDAPAEAPPPSAAPGPSTPSRCCWPATSGPASRSAWSSGRSC